MCLLDCRNEGRRLPTRVVAAAVALPTRRRLTEARFVGREACGGIVKDCKNQVGFPSRPASTIGQGPGAMLCCPGCDDVFPASGTAPAEIHGKEIGLRWLNYVPRFLRHYRHRRKSGYTFEQAVRSTRERMLAYATERESPRGREAGPRLSKR